METNNNIPIKNVYYMLAYAYRIINLVEYNHIGTEEFHNTKELYCEVLLIGLPTLIRRGLTKDYISINERTTVVKGKIDINLSIKQNALVDKKLVVRYDEFSEDIILNQIIKATLVRLSCSNQIDKVKRKKFFSFLPYFSNVSDIELNINLWKKISYSRQNIRYQFIIDICRYLYEELLINENDQNSSSAISDDQKLSSLFEKFVFAFYKQETKYKVTHPQIAWNVDDDFYEALPIMQTDIVLQEDNKTLILDTKFYTENMAIRYPGGTAKQKSHNLYQIFTYINNWKARPGEEVSGMLMYARTKALTQPNHTYNINGNKTYIVNLNLNQEFILLKNELLQHARNNFESID